MTKTRRKLFSVLLAFCMVTSLFTEVPANAAGDYDYEQKGDVEINPVYGLIATQYLSYNEDNLLLKDGYPADAKWDDDGLIEDTLKPIDYTDGADISVKGERFWFDYRKTVDGERTHVKAEDITKIEYYPDSNPWEEDARVEIKTNLTNLLKDGADDLVIFTPQSNEVGTYWLYYKDEIKPFSIHVDYPTIGFYSAPERSAENLLLDDYSSNCTSDYFMYHGAENVVYMNAYGNANSEMRFPTDDDLDEHSDWRSAFTVDIATYVEDEETGESNRIEDTLTGDANGIENYLAVEEVTEVSDSENNDHWYKLTFSETIKVDEKQLPINDYNLNVTMVRTDSQMTYDETGEETGMEDGDPYTVDAWFGGSYHSLGFTATVDNEEYPPNRNWIETSAIDPEHFKISFKKTSADNDGKVESSSVDLTEIKLEKDKNYGLFDEEDNPKEVNWGVATDEECTMTIKDGVLDCVFHYQGQWRFSLGTDEEYIYVNNFLEDVAFWETPNRPADSEPVNGRLVETTVDEGKTQKVYALAWMDNDNGVAPKTDTIAIKAYVDGTEKPSYIKVDETPTTDNRKVNHFFGYGVEITDAATEDFTIVVTAERNCIDIYRDEEGNETGREELSWARDAGIRCEFPVKINAIKELEISTPPTKTVYEEEETFSAEGMVVKVVYADGRKEAITDYSVPTDKLSASDESVEISYRGKKVSQAITVNAKQAQETPSPAPTSPTSGGGVSASPSPSPTGKPTPSPKPTSSPKPTPGGKPTATPSPAPLTNGKKVEDSKGNRYKVTNAKAKNPTVEYTAPKKGAKGSVTVPDTVTINGTKCKVTSIAANAFKNNKKITKITVGKNITSIGKNAFSGCKKLKTIVIKSTKLTSKSVKKDAFKGISSKTTIKVPKKQLKAYKKLFRKKGLSKKVKITK